MKATPHGRVKVFHLGTLQLPWHFAESVVGMVKHNSWVIRMR